MVLHAEVSVPSTGRSGLQRDEAGENAAAYLSFSTLYGSKWVATPSRRSSPLQLPSFSTLYGSKWVATCGELLSVECVESFSTLYGSKWVATERYGSMNPTKGGFQYPLRVEVGCNARGSQLR